MRLGVGGDVGGSEGFWGGADIEEPPRLLRVPAHRSVKRSEQIYLRLPALETDNVVSPALAATRGTKMSFWAPPLNDQEAGKISSQTY